MNGRRRWQDAEEAAHWLDGRNGVRSILLLLARLPLLSEKVIERLSGLRGGASVYQSLRQLRERGLVAAFAPAMRPGHSPRLYYLTDLGLATVALYQGIEPEDLARRARLHGSDLVNLLPGLPQLAACYGLLAAIATSRPGSPNLLAWERPWRRHFQRPAFRSPTRVELPAYAALSWKGEAADFLLVPDLATFPLRAYRTTLDRLLLLRNAQRAHFPAIVVATTDPRRAAAWRHMLEDSGRARFDAPLLACIGTWDDLPHRLDELPHFMDTAGLSIEALSGLIQLKPLRPRRPGSSLACFVGNMLSTSSAVAGADNRLGGTAIRLSATDRALLDITGRHPFQTPARLAVMLGCQVKQARERQNRLIALGLMRPLGTEEIRGSPVAPELVELTERGLALAAAQQGLSVAAAVRYNGLAGGEADNPTGSRRLLVANLSHTLGANGIFVHLMETAQRLAASGGDDALAEWRNAAACSRRHLRPDGYGIYRHEGRLYGFFLEYDQGTMSTRDYLQKFDAYFEFLTGGDFSRDYDGFPTILVVTKDRTSEERIERSARAAAVGRGTEIPLLLTCEWRIYRDPGNPDGLLGPIWREPGSTRRRYWLLNTSFVATRSRCQPKAVDLPGSTTDGSFAASPLSVSVDVRRGEGRAPLAARREAGY